MVPSEWWEGHLLTKTHYFVDSYLRDLVINFSSRTFYQNDMDTNFREKGLKRLNTTVFWVAWIIRSL